MAAVTKAAELAMLRLHVKNTEALCLQLAVALNDAKKDIRALKLDQHPPLNFRAALDHYGVTHNGRD